MLQFFKELLQAFFEELHRVYENYLRFQDPSIRMGNQLRILYGRGEITTEQFNRLKNMLSRGQPIQGELHIAQRVALSRSQAGGEPFAHRRWDEMARLLDRLYLDRALVKEAQFETEAALQALGGDVGWLLAQGESARGQAQSALPDETLARGWLEVRYDLLAHARDLQARQSSLHQELQNLGALDAELRSSIAQCTALQAQTDLEWTKMQINRDLSLERGRR